MKKDEFLKALGQRLHILNERERQDILDEYAQHMELKIKNGMDEEAAAADFGDIKELADEILSAYNVDLKYNRPNFLQNFRERMKKAFQAAGNGCRIFFQKYFGGFSRMWKRVKKQGREATGAGAEEKAEMLSYKKKRTVLTQETEKTMRTMKHFGRGFGSFCRRLLHIFIKLGRYLCLACIFAASLPFLGLSAVCLFALGTVFILLVQGYPLIGIIIMLLGSFACSASLAGLLLSFVFHGKERKQKKAELKKRNIQGSRAEKEKRGAEEEPEAETYQGTGGKAEGRLA